MSSTSSNIQETKLEPGEFTFSTQILPLSAIPIPKKKSKLPLQPIQPIQPLTKSKSKIDETNRYRTYAQNLPQGNTVVLPNRTFHRTNKYVVEHLGGIFSMECSTPGGNPSAISPPRAATRGFRSRA